MEVLCVTKIYVFPDLSKATHTQCEKGGVLGQNLLFWVYLLLFFSLLRENESQIKSILCFLKILMRELFCFPKLMERNSLIFKMFLILVLALRQLQNTI